jgi:hypothetical protein
MAKERTLKENGDKLYSASVLFGSKKRNAGALGLIGSLEKAGPCPNKMLVLYNGSLHSS